MIRAVMAVWLGLAALASGAMAQEVGEDGLYKQPWFSTTFRDVREDIAEAASEGKRLAIIFEQRGCIYCKKLHEEVLSDPEVRDYIKANFKIVQYNLFGDEEVTDLDGKSLSEKTAARRWRIVYTPTIVFLPEKAPQGGTVAEAAVSVMPGAFGKSTTLDMFRWVREKGYLGKEHFQKYHARMIEERRKAARTN